MDKIIEQIVDLVNKDKKRIITISETSHWSYTSHTFHYKLLKSLHQNAGFTCFSSERLGILDSFLMNQWLKGEIDCSLDYLYSSLLPFGGLGTYRWMRYFQKGNNFFLVGCEMDNLNHLSEKKRKNLEKVLNQFTTHQVDFNKKINWKAITKEDKIIKYGINLFLEEGWDKRYNVWLKHIKQTITPLGI